MPRVLLEDRLALLRALVAGAWLMLLAMVGLELALRSAAPELWPQHFGFSQTYNLLLAVFAVNCVFLTGLLIRRNWFERVPREAERRVSVLLAAVLVWLGLFVFYLFHITGSVQGPLLLLLPVLIVAALTWLPEAGGLALAAYLMAGHAGVVLAERAGLVAERGALAPVFALTPEPGVAGGAGLLLALLLALLLGLGLRRWVYPEASLQHPARRVDPDTGLFREPFFWQRAERELRRGQRQKATVALVLLQLPEPSDSADAPSRCALLLGAIRRGSDSPTRLTDGRLAVLLPATRQEHTEAFCRRLRAVYDNAGLPGAQLVAVLVPPGKASVSALREAAADAHGVAPDGASGNEVVFRTLPGSPAN